MKKTLLLFCALLSLCGGAWADVTVKLSDQTDLGSITNKSQSEAETVHKYGTYASGTGGTTFTTNATSGLPGLVVSTTGNFIKPTFHENTKYLHCLAITPTAGYETTYTVTITAPSGYYIKSYSMTAISTSENGKFDVKPLGGTTKTVTSAQQTIDVTACANTASFTLKRNTGSTNDTELCFPSFTVTLASTTLSGSYSLDLNSTTGTATRDGGSTPTNGADFRTYTSTASPAGLTLVAGSGNSMNWTLTTMNLHSYGGTYTLTAPSGYSIKGYKMSTYVSADKINTIKPAGATTTTRISDDSSHPTIICVDNIYANSTTFARASSDDANKDYAITTFTVYLEPVVTYTVVDGEATASGGSAVQTVGSVPNIANTVGANAGSSYNNPYCTYAYYSDAECETSIATIAGPCTVYAKVASTSSVPVEFASAVDDENATWYTLKLRGYSFYVSGGTVTISSTDVASANAQWVFTGSVYNAYIYNKYAGQYLVMSAGALALSDDPEPWILAPHQSGSGSYFYYASDYKFPFRNSNGNLAYSQGPFYETADAASFVATEVADDYSLEIEANVQPFFTTGVGSYFGLKSDVVSTYGSRVTAAAESCDADEYSALLAVVSTASNFVYPPSGLYRIKNYSTSAYWGQTGATPAINFGQTDAASVLYLTRSGEEGSYMYTIKLQGTQFIDTKDQSTGNYELSVVAPGRFTMNDHRSNTVFGYTYANGTAIGYTNLGSDACYWTIEDATSATFSLTAANDNTGANHTYATLCVPFNVTGLTGVSSKEVKAYTPTQSGAYIVTGTGATTIDAGMPVILIGEDADATSVTAAIGSSYVTSPEAPTSEHVLTGKFAGTNINCTAATGNYVLGFDATNYNRIGFYHVNNASFALKANRAYLNTEVVGDVKGFVINFDDLVDGIGSLTPDPSPVGEGSIYNLAGQRINKLQRGVNIVNGKKVIVK